MTLSECGHSFGKSLEKGKLDECGEIIGENWNAEKVITPRVSNAYLDEVYEYAKQAGMIGGKLSGAGGGGYFVFYTRNRETLGRKIVEKFPKCYVQPIRFVYADIKQLNR